jgi:hypothetical protein
MAAIAGKVAITPKGEWNADTQYEKLDFVLHGSDSYVARKNSIGIEPGSDDETWQLSLRGASSEDIQKIYGIVNDIVNGTTKVGDAETVNGWQIYSRPSDLGFSAPLTMAELCAAMPNKSLLVWANVSTDTTDHVTDTPGTHGILTVTKRGTWASATWIRINKGGKIPLWAGSWHSDTGWSGWSSTDDYLPLTGGTLSGTVQISPATGYPMLNLINNDTKRTAHFNSNAANLVSWFNMKEGSSSNSTSVVLGTESETLGNLLRLTRTVNGSQSVYQVHHTGNSQKVAISATAPTDGLWVVP